MNLGGATAVRDDPARRAGDRRRPVPHRRLRLLRRAAEAAVARGRTRRRAARAYGFARGCDAAYGFFGVNAMYALVARRHMHRLRHHAGPPRRDRGRPAPLGQPEPAGAAPRPAAHARRLPRARAGSSEPFHLFDCCLVSNGGLAVIVTSAERARALRKPPVYVLGHGAGTPGRRPGRDARLGRRASRRSRRSRWPASRSRDVDVVELYDCYTFTVLVTLEDYGFCAKGEGGPFVAEHHTGPGGALAVNTGGGQLSSFYMWGMTPMSEAVIQLRGEGGARQVAEARRRAGVRQRRHPVDALDAGALEAAVVSETASPPRPPVPAITPEMAPFWEAARRHELVGAALSRLRHAPLPGPRGLQPLPVPRAPSGTGCRGRGASSASPSCTRPTIPASRPRCRTPWSSSSSTKGARMLSNVVGLGAARRSRSACRSRSSSRT